ncbi:MAG: hypoxanthine phosphoribosyltransferase [Thermoanaerobaculia bacterium]|nr:hypoxanthine phosphoribosyltransferase [Thermoanaerobaculia bacterium]
MTSDNSNHYPRPLIEQADLEAKIGELAAAVTRDYRDSERLVAIGVLKGSVFFLVDLLKRVDLAPLEVDFFQTSSYGAATEPGEVKILKDVDVSVRGADVLLIEDIVDTGYTLRTILDLLRFRKAKSVRLCTLLDKPSRRKVDVPIDYCGFQIEDLFVVGYGLDYNERFRNLPYIGVYEGEIR